MKNLFTVLAIGCVVAGCAGNPHVADDAQVNRALKVCGLGTNSMAADAYRALYESATKKGVSLEKEASTSIDTQVMALLKQADTKSDAAIRMQAEEIKNTRGCVLDQLGTLQPVSTAQLLEQCRQDIQRRLSPPGNTGYGTVRVWNQANGKLSEGGIVEMNGLFDVGGSASFNFSVTCDIRNGRFNEAAMANSGR